MSENPKNQRPGYGHALLSPPAWLGIVFLLASCFFLFFHVPKIEANRRDLGLSSPAYLKSLFLLSHYVPAILLGGIILIVFLSRSRD